MHHFWNIYYQVIEKSFRCLQVPFAMARKAWKFLLKRFFGKTLIGDNAGQDYDCFWGLGFDFVEALTSFKFKRLMKFSSLLIWTALLKIFCQLVRIFEKIADETAFNTYFNAFRSLALEIKTINLLISRRIEHYFPVYSKYVGPGYHRFE